MQAYPEQTDPSDRRLREEGEQRVNRNELAPLLVLTSHAIRTVDAMYRITLFNLGAEGIFGYGASEVLGQPLAILFPLRLRATYQQLVENLRSLTVIKPVAE